MSIFLPVAGISIDIWILIAAGCLVGFLSGLLGVGGGFLLTPILTYMPSPLRNGRAPSEHGRLRAGGRLTVLVG
jgi:Sulfite exporter TauE/SafE